jgi:stress response protein YsnF
MTNNIAEIEQRANEALSKNRRELAEETAKIDREPDLSEEAKARYVGEARTSEIAERMPRHLARLEYFDSLIRGDPHA